MNLAFVGTPATGNPKEISDEKMLPHLKGMMNGNSCYVHIRPISTYFEVQSYCKQRNITGVISTNITLLEKLLGWKDNRKRPSLDSYAGSYFNRDGIEFVFVDPLAQIQTVPYGKFLTSRYISKLTARDSWGTLPDFNFSIATANNIEDTFQQFRSAILISYDIETLRQYLQIRCMGYTAIFANPDGSLSSKSIVLPLDSMWAVAWMRKFNWELPAPKVAQNGKYDCAYLARWNAPMYNYLFDTANMMHCVYSELPKDLAFLNSFWVREAVYWKDLANTQDLMEYYRYNALDTWATACCAIRWLLTAPAYAKHNYEQEFPLVFPTHLCEMTGIKRDMTALEKSAKDLQVGIAAKEKSLERITATPGFNSNSPKQVLALLGVLGCKGFESSDEKHLNKAAYLHPLNSFILGKILDIRGERKLLSTYLPTGNDPKTGEYLGKELDGRILYALNPHGTDTGRLISREHHFWNGLNIQNIPRGKEVKYTLVADEGFVFGECDLEQAESRDTAYASGDERLIYAVEADHDFHSYNASKFFGRAYDSIYDAIKRKTKDKVLRDLSKRVNHGANYCMGANVLVDTMGLENIYKAQSLLKLPAHWTPVQIAEHLLEQFHKTYPTIAGVFYPGIISDVVNKRMLTGATGWTRYCFGDPVKNKRNKNAYVAHVPQSLNAMVLNKAFMRVFYDIAIHPDHCSNFKLCAQIHDSILFQFRKGHDYLCAMVKERMEIPVTIKGYDGKVRTFVVPAAIKAGPDGLGSHRWSDTE